MAFKLTKQEAAQVSKMADALDEAGAALTDAVNAYNEAMAKAFEAVAAARDAYNEAVSDARGMVEDLVSDRRSEWEDKSEKWQESDKGQDAERWISEWEGIDLEEVEVSEPEAIEEPDLTHAEALREGPEE